MPRYFDSYVAKLNMHGMHDVENVTQSNTRAPNYFIFRHSPHKHLGSKRTSLRQLNAKNVKFVDFD